MRILTLEDWRNRLSLSRLELARKANISPSTVWRIERGKHVPVLATRRALALALGQDSPDGIAWPRPKMPQKRAG